VAEGECVVVRGSVCCLLIDATIPPDEYPRGVSG
jgi:hypothetical protein